MNYINYIVKEGDRWDTISYEMYNDPYLYEIIIKANPQFLAHAYPPAGTVLKIPVLEIEDTDNQEVINPPWQTD
jgi:nucleoid-associated protein YgaU